MVLGQLDSHMQRMRLDCLTPHTQKSAQRTQDILAGKPLRRRQAASSSILVLAILVWTSLLFKGNKSKSKQMVPHQTKSFCTRKEAVNEMKRQPRNRKMPCKSYVQWRLLSEIYVNVKNWYNSSLYNLIKEWTQDWTGISPKNTFRPGQHACEGCSTYDWSIWKRTPKPQWDTTSHLSEWQLSKRQKMTDVGEDVEKKGTASHPVRWWEYRLVQPLWKKYKRFFKKLKLGPPYNSVIPLLGIYLNKMK